MRAQSEFKIAVCFFVAVAMIFTAVPFHGVVLADQHWDEDYDHSDDYGIPIDEADYNDGEYDDGYYPDDGDPLTAASEFPAQRIELEVVTGGGIYQPIPGLPAAPSSPSTESEEGAAEKASQDAWEKVTTAEQRLAKLRSMKAEWLGMDSPPMTKARIGQRLEELQGKDSRGRDTGIIPDLDKQIADAERRIDVIERRGEARGGLSSAQKWNLKDAQQKLKDLIRDRALVGKEYDKLMNWQGASDDYWRKFKALHELETEIKALEPQVMELRKSAEIADQELERIRSLA